MNITPRPRVRLSCGKYFYSVVDFIVQTVEGVDYSYASTFWSRLLSKNKECATWREEVRNASLLDKNDESEVTPCAKILGLQLLLFELTARSKIPHFAASHVLDHLNQVIIREHEVTYC